MIRIGGAYLCNRTDLNHSQRCCSIVSGSAASSTRPNSTNPDEFLIGNDDVLTINVWKEPEISRAIPVRSDGKVSLPLVGELQAGARDSQEAADLYLGAGSDVIIQEIKSQKFNILGQITQ